MPKPYSILAAALAASGRSLSTVTLAAPVEFHPGWAGRQTEDWLLDSNREGSLELGVALHDGSVRAARPCKCRHAVPHSPRL